MMCRFCRRNVEQPCANDRESCVCISPELIKAAGYDSLEELKKAAADHVKEKGKK